MVLEAIPTVCAALLGGLADAWTQLLPDLRDARASNLSTLRDWRLGPEDLRRTGIHTKQMTPAMDTRYRDAVGPWNHADYLPILQETREEPPCDAACVSPVSSPWR